MARKTEVFQVLPEVPGLFTSMGTMTLLTVSFFCRRVDNRFPPDHLSYPIVAVKTYGIQRTFDLEGVFSGMSIVAGKALLSSKRSMDFLSFEFLF